MMFQEPLSHAAVGVWIKSGDLRYLVINNRAVLDMPGEYVCTEEGGVASVSYIAPAGYAADTVPVMSQVNKIISITNAESVSVEGLELVHTNYVGLDRGMNWQDGALVVKNSNGRNININYHNDRILFQIFKLLTTNSPTQR